MRGVSSTTCHAAGVPGSRDVRERNACQREHAVRARLDSAARRDEVADARDLTVLSRTQAVAMPELPMTAHDLADE